MSDDLNTRRAARAKAGTYLLIAICTVAAAVVTAFFLARQP